MVASNSMVQSADALLVEIETLDREMAARRQRVRWRFGALRRVSRARLTSPPMMFGAFGIGFVFGRATAGPARRRAADDQPRHDAGLFERILLAVALMRSWAPLVRGVAGWFERPARTPLDEGRFDVQTPYFTEVLQAYPGSAYEPPITAPQSGPRT